MFGFGIQNSYMVPWAADIFRGIPGSMNIQFNQGIADLQARASMWQVPTFDFGMSMYPNMPMTGLEGLLNPQYTWNQQMWNAATGANSAFSCFGGGMGAGMANPFGMGGFNMGAGMTNPFGMGGFNMGGVSGSSDSSSSSSPEQKKYNKLLTFLKQLNKCVQDNPASYRMTTDQKEKLEELSRGSKEKDIEAKYNELQTFYDSLDKEDLKRFVTEGSKDLSINGQSNGNKILEKLTRAGYETETSKVDKDNFAVSMHDKLKNVDKTDSHIADVMDDVAKYPILEVLSTYYSKYNNDDDLITMLFKATKKNGVDRESIKADFNLVITSLTKEAKSVASQIGGDTAKKLNEKADKLEKAYGDFESESDIKKYFKEVYVMTRLASTMVIEKTLADAYDYIDSSLFKTDSFIMENVKEDLNKEGFVSIVNSLENEVKINNSSSNSPEPTEEEKEMLAIGKMKKADRTDEQHEKYLEYRKTIYKKMQDAKVIETKAEKGQYKDYRVYKTVGGDPEYVYLNNEYKFVPVKKNSDESFSLIEGNIESYTPKELKAKTAETEEETTDEETDEYALITGYDVFRNIADGKNISSVNGKLNSLNKDNVVKFLRQCNFRPGTWRQYTGQKQLEGLIEKIVDEVDGEEKVTGEAIVNLLNAVKEYAEEKYKDGKGYKKDEDYKYIVNVINCLGNNTDDAVYATLNTGSGNNRKCELLDRAIYNLLKNCNDTGDMEPLERP